MPLYHKYIFWEPKPPETDPIVKVPQVLARTAANAGLCITWYCILTIRGQSPIRPAVTLPAGMTTPAKSALYLSAPDGPSTN